jgi:hypothetical protein
MTKSVALALLLTGATCGGMAPGNEPTSQPELEFEVLGGMQTAAGDSVAVAGVVPGEAILTGVITTPNPCYRVAAELAEDGHTLTVTLRATALPRICPQVVAAFEYRARLSHLASGVYTVHVVHAYPGTGWEGKRYQLRVELPQ